MSAARALPLLLLLSACSSDPEPAPRGTSPVTSSAPATRVDPVRGELLIFVAPATRSGVAADVLATHLPAWRKLAAAEGVAVRTMRVADGAPTEVGITPLLVYQNHRGRSVFQGRYTSRGRLQTFLRTSRWVPQGKAPLVRQDVWTRQRGRATQAVVLKVTPLKGSVPAGHDAAAFAREARSAFSAGLEGYTRVPEARLTRSDRTFYADVHPYRDPSGALFLSLALFSQFHCEEPVFTTKVPVAGPWAKRPSVFAAAAQRFVAAVDAATRDPKRGDGFDPVSASAAPTWEALGAPLPPAPKRTRATPSAAVTLATRWTLQPRSKDEPPQLQFAFPAPLDSYQGEVKTVRCSLGFPDGLALSGMRGQVEAVSRSVSMGDVVLDGTIHGASFLSSDAHKAATFRVTRVDAEGNLSLGELHQVVIHGPFTLKGKTVQVEARGTVEAYLTEAGKLRLLARGSFQLRLKEAFGISGPDGPSPQNDTLQFHYRFVLAPQA